MVVLQLMWDLEKSCCPTLPSACSPDGSSQRSASQLWGLSTYCVQSYCVLSAWWSPFVLLPIIPSPLFWQKPSNSEPPPCSL